MTSRASRARASSTPYAASSLPVAVGAAAAADVSPSVVSATSRHAAAPLEFRTVKVDFAIPGVARPVPAGLNSTRIFNAPSWDAVGSLQIRLRTGSEWRQACGIGGPIPHALASDVATSPATWAPA